MLNVVSDPPAQGPIPFKSPTNAPRPAAPSDDQEAGAGYGLVSINGEVLEASIELSFARTPSFPASLFRSSYGFSARSPRGPVSRAPRELAAARNRTRDEGGLFEFGDQEPISRGSAFEGPEHVLMRWRVIRPMNARALASVFSCLTVCLRIRELCLSADPWGSRRKAAPRGRETIPFSGANAESAPARRPPNRVNSSSSSATIAS
jgi:hypothetical protein